MIATAIDPQAPISERLTDLFIVVLKVIREHPLLERLARVEPDALLHELLDRLRGGMRKPVNLFPALPRKKIQVVRGEFLQVRRRHRCQMGVAADDPAAYRA